MGLLTRLRTRLRRTPPDPERALQRARAEAALRAARAQDERRAGGLGGY